jgi:hypothetical protein
VVGASTFRTAIPKARREHFGSLQNNAALDYARAILEFVRDEMA